MYITHLDNWLNSLILQLLFDLATTPLPLLWLRSIHFNVFCSGWGPVLPGESELQMRYYELLNKSFFLLFVAWSVTCSVLLGRWWWVTLFRATYARINLRLFNQIRSVQMVTITFGMMLWCLLKDDGWRQLVQCSEPNWLGDL